MSPRSVHESMDDQSGTNTPTGKTRHPHTPPSGHQPSPPGMISDDDDNDESEYDEVTVVSEEEIIEEEILAEEEEEDKRERQKPKKTSSFSSRTSTKSSSSSSSSRQKDPPGDNERPTHQSSSPSWSSSSSGTSRESPPLPVSHGKKPAAKVRSLPIPPPPVSQTPPQSRPHHKQPSPPPPPPPPRTLSSKSQQLVKDQKPPAAALAATVAIETPTMSTKNQRQKREDGGRTGGYGGGRHRHRRKLTWKKSVRVNVIPNLGFYTAQEKLDSWYQAEEYTIMEDECDMTSQFMDSGQPIYPGFCGRGLEGWTMVGEQRKEQHVQLAIDIVWQAQLDQWRQSSNTDECWEFIRGQYLQISKPCLMLAVKLARQDEKEVEGYMKSVKALESSRRKMLGIKDRPTRNASRSKIQRHRVGRVVSDTAAATAISPGKSPHRSFSDARSPPTTPDGRIVRSALKYTTSDDDPQYHAAEVDKTPKMKGRKELSVKTPSSTVAKKKSAAATPTTDALSSLESESTSNASSSAYECKGIAAKKIAFKPKSKTKIPTSPVGSVCTNDSGDTSSTMRRMRSHMSVASEESTRRRMLRTAALKTL